MPSGELWAISDVTEEFNQINQSINHPTRYSMIHTIRGPPGQEGKEINQDKSEFITQQSASKSASRCPNPSFFQLSQGMINFWVSPPRRLQEMAELPFGTDFLPGVPLRPSQMVPRGWCNNHQH